MKTKRFQHGSVVVERRWVRGGTQVALTTFACRNIKYAVVAGVVLGALSLVHL